MSALAASTLSARLAMFRRRPSLFYLCHVAESDCDTSASDDDEFTLEDHWA